MQILKPKRLFASLIACSTVFACTGRRSGGMETKPPMPASQPGQQPGAAPQPGVTPPSGPVSPDGNLEPPPIVVGPEVAPNVGPGGEPAGPVVPSNPLPPSSPIPPSSPGVSPGLPPSPNPGVSPQSQPQANPDGNLSVNGSTIVIQNMTLTVPSGWTLHQEARSGGVMFAGFARANDYFRIYVKQGSGVNMQSVFVNGSQSSGEKSEQIGGKTYKRLDATMGQVQIAAFLIEHQGHTYYGFGRGASPATIVQEFLNALK